jgi:Putative Tad-like Flp pilus-assembly
MRRENESGQAILLVVVAMGLFLVGAMGLAIDGASLYGHIQMAQTAADAAAEASVLSILDRTNTSAYSNDFTTGGDFRCDAAKAAWTPCLYASKNRFSPTTDKIDVSFPGSLPGVTGLAGGFTPNLVKVTVTRTVSATLMKLLGGTATDIHAIAIAAVVQEDAPVPIVVTHPTLAPSLIVGGNTYIKICGGPQESIQVNSDGTVPSGATVAGNGTGVGNTAFDLSRGGPHDTNGDCTTPGVVLGTDMGSFGPADATANPFPFAIVPGVIPLNSCAKGSLCIGTGGHYKQPFHKIDDPLFDVAPPADPGSDVASPDGVATLIGFDGCPAVPVGGSCKRFFPGRYPTGIHANGFTAIMQPGIYYISGAPPNGSDKDVGFSTGASGAMIMCSGTNCVSDTSGCCTGNGMLVYLASAGGNLNKFDLGSNGQASLTGADTNSTYKGILIFVARNAPTQIHKLGGGGNMSIKGTLYATNCTPGLTCPSPTTNMTTGIYQKISLGGNSGSGTVIRGEIITSVLDLSGGGNITMQLDPFLKLPTYRVALVK